MRNDIETVDAALKPLHSEAWQALVDGVRDYSPDLVVLVARKMPRLVEALNLSLGDYAVCVSDHAIPFVHQNIKGARVAIVDDIWNVGTTMLRARDRVLLAAPREVQLFALAAKNAETALESGVNLALPRSLPAERHRILVDAVPRALRCVAKPYDVDFPIVPCTIRAPFSSWHADSARCRPAFRDDLAHHSDLKSPTHSEMMSPTIPG